MDDSLTGEPPRPLPANAGIPPSLFVSAMTFTLLRLTNHGWTDQHGDASAEFPTEDAARDASIELDDVWATASEWKILPTAELGNYELV